MNMRKGAKRLLGALVLAGGIGAGTMVSTAPAHAESCFWEDIGRSGSSRCFANNVQDFAGVQFPNGHDIRNTASSWQNLNTIFNEFVYSEPNFTGAEQELEDETFGNLTAGIADHLGSYDAV
jgi:hypothetical protein